MPLNKETKPKWLILYTKKDGTNTFSIYFSKEIVTTILMPYKSTKAMSPPSDGGTYFFFYIITWMLQGDILALFQFTVCLD